MKVNTLWKKGRFFSMEKQLEMDFFFLTPTSLGLISSVFFPGVQVAD